MGTRPASHWATRPQGPKAQCESDELDPKLHKQAVTARAVWAGSMSHGKSRAARPHPSLYPQPPWLWRTWLSGQCGASQSDRLTLPSGSGPSQAQLQSCSKPSPYRKSPPPFPAPTPSRLGALTMAATAPASPGSCLETQHLGPRWEPLSLYLNKTPHVKA